MKDHIWVFGFDNTLVNTEDIIVRLTAEVLDIPLTEEFWYANLHSVPSVEDEMRILQESFGVEYTPELQQQTGAKFVGELAGTEPNRAVYAMLKEHLGQSWLLTGSPKEICDLYLSAWDVAVPEGRMRCGVYNASGDKERILAELQQDHDVTYVDDDADLVRAAGSIVSEVLLVRQPYNEDAWGELETI
ncbi:MAG: hypothetical protein Q4A93_03295 [Actinomycetota bacterium]|nr:hypothetical protein [Actinomycetota bacterium]